MTTQLKGYTLLGDPHMGRGFRTGVPLALRGKREESMFRDLKRSFEETPAGYHHVCLGDLFDGVNPGLSTILEVAKTYVWAAENLLLREIWVICGNHDKGRDSSVTTAWDVFCALMSKVSEVHCINETTLFDDGKVMFVPWGGEPPLAGIHPYGLEYVFIHALPEEVPNWVLESLSDTGHVYCGHEHVRRTLGSHITSVGSMQPYTHGEDPEHNTYKTISLQEYAEADENSFQEKAVRILLRPGESPINIEDDHTGAMQITFQQSLEMDEETKAQTGIPETPFSEFCFGKQLMQNLSEAGVTTKRIEEMTAILEKCNVA